MTAIGIDEQIERADWLASEMNHETDAAILASLEELKRIQSVEIAEPVMVPDEFVAWLEREIPPGTVISNPKWWASKIYRAAIRAAFEGKS